MQTPKQYTQRKIKQLVHLHAVHIEQLTGLQVNAQYEYNRIYNHWQANLITTQQIQDDIDEYLHLQGQHRG